jgi:DNA adenine methylase
MNINVILQGIHAINTNTGNNIKSILKSGSNAKPFLKWAGGKTQLIPDLSKLLPATYNKYIEPNVSLISDLNNELIVTYEAIKNDVERVIDALLTYNTDEQTYYRIRSIIPESLDLYERAARLIYLNKACYNGLYRVNKKGEFNVPYGKREKIQYNVENLKKASSLLKKTLILQGDYLTILKRYAKTKDLIFLDPPYYPVSEYSDFKRYTKEFFYKDDQITLRSEFDRLVHLGCHVVLTNSDHPFILELYKDYEIKRVETKRLISCKTSSRHGTDIIVLGNL